MIPIKVTTEYSLLTSLIKIPDLINYLKKNNINVCGICDTELFGCMEFYLKCQENNIKPIIGLDVVIDNYHYYLYAKNYLGYQMLLKINTKKNNNTLELKDLINNNIYVIIPFASIDNFDFFKNNSNCYLGYSTLKEKQNELLLTSNILFTNNIRCFNKEDLKYLMYLKDLGGIFSYTDTDYFLVNKDSDDNKRINEFVSKINLEIPFNKRFIPKYKENINSYDYLYNLTKLGLEKRLNGQIPDIYKDRLDMELKVISSMGFVDYFLIVYDYVLYAKKHNILVGPGRGSAAGSLVSYVLGITNIDPIKYNLLFSRFLNPSRKKMPDIDIDFEDTKRSEVIKYVKERYGADKVAVGITFNSMKCKLVLRDLARSLKVDESLMNKFMKNINGQISLKDNLNNVNINKFLKLYPELNKLYDIAMHLENLKKNVSTHAAGVVICSCPLDDIIPVYDDGTVVRTGIAMEYLEMLGILKMDFLSLRNLSIIGNIISKIPNIKLENIPLDDQKTYQLFADADTDDIFQFESSYAKTNLSKLKVSNFDELCNAIALVRPGPADQIDAYCQNKNNPNLKIEDNLKDILAATYGIIIYQEQVMNIFKKIASFTDEEADNVRIAMSKKKEEIILKYQDKFIHGAKNNGYSQKYAEELFLKVKKFAEYGFNKSHSVSYAIIAYQMAYLKVNYPVEFTIALLDENRDITTKKRLINYLKENNIKVLAPSINVSSDKYQYKNGYLLLPMSIIKGLTSDNIQNLTKYKYNDIFDFVIKCQDFLNDKLYETIVQSGLLDTFKINKKTLMENKDVLFNYAFLGDYTAEKPLLEKYSEYDKDTLRELENTYYGFYIGNHPCSIYKDYFKIKQIKSNLFKNVKMVLLVEKVNRIKTKNGEDMAFVLVSDETGTSEITLFPESYQMISDIKYGDLIAINGKTSKRFDKYQIIVNNIKRK